MKALVPLVGLAAVAGITVFAVEAHAGQGSRKFWLINGKRYVLAVKMTGPGWDASMFPGFCQFSQPTISGQKDGYTLVQFAANWCNANYQWDVPTNVAIDEA